MPRAKPGTRRLNSTYERVLRKRQQKRERRSIPDIGALLKAMRPTAPPGGAKPKKRGMTRAAAESPAKVNRGKAQIEDRRKRPLPRPPGRGRLY